MGSTVIARRAGKKQAPAATTVSRSETVAKVNGSDAVTPVAWMAGQTQKNFKHEVPKEPRVTQPRINLTFRRIKHK